MFIPNDYTQNYPLCRLQFVVETFGYTTAWTNQSKFNEVPKFLKLISKRYYKTLVTIVINSPISPPSLVENTQ